MPSYAAATHLINVEPLVLNLNLICESLDCIHVLAGNIKLPVRLLYNPSNNAGWFVKLL